ncbi:hypothetical protein ACFL6K_05155 [Candidatus Latescibacterota bacterium]
MPASAKKIISFVACFILILISSSFADSSDSTNDIAESFLLAQTSVPVDSIDESVSTQDGANIDNENSLNVYLDISSSYQDYIKTEITFVNYVRDRKEAQVHILHTRQQTSSGGTEHSLNFIGQHNFAGHSDTLKYVSKAMETQELIRAGLVKTIKMGLMPYVAKTPSAENISIIYNAKEIKKEVVDKWDYWVFRLGSNGYLNGEESRKQYNFSESLSANRITEDWKIQLSASSSYSSNSYKFDSRNINSIRRSHSGSGQIVKSLTDHWSAGMSSSASSSIYSNNKLSYSFSPALEYNIFPYSESTRRELSFVYNVNFTNKWYDEETIYLKTHEKLLSESLNVNYRITEKWGSISTSIYSSHYFHDFSKNSLGFYSGFSLRLFEGLSLSLDMDYSRIHDQLSLPSRGATTEQILLNQKQLASQYNFYISAGFSYTFGSIYTNIVNPRL